MTLLRIEQGATGFPVTPFYFALPISYQVDYFVVNLPISPCPVIQFVVSLNLPRRHLDTNQRSLVAGRLARMLC